MKYKAIIFDMDGTIIDTEHIWREATHTLISSRGITVTPQLAHEIEERCHGVAMAQSCAVIKELTKIPDSIETLVDEKSRLACALYATKVRYINGFLDFHKKALAHNLKVGVATNADPQTVMVTDQRLDLRTLFGEHVYNISHVNFVGKPNPAIYLHAAQQLGIDPQHCIAIEDSPGGVKAATAAGMYCIGINTAQKPALLTASHMIIDGYHEIDLKKILEI